MEKSAADLVISSYKQLLDAEEMNDVKQWDTLLVPVFEEETLKKLIDETISVLKTEKSLVELSGNCVVVGDIHGNLYDLMRIFHKFGPPPQTQYVFLGDYVDRGEFSLEVISLLFAFKTLYPLQITLIRGNHECKSINEHYGFMQQCEEMYKCNRIWRLFNVGFTFLPLVAILNQRFFLVHGGITNKMNVIEYVKSLKFPIDEMNPIVEDLLWSDPVIELSMFSENPRGKGCCYGGTAVQIFLDDHGYSAIIRGHQCVTNGVQYAFNKKVITIFSSSNYVNESNSSGVLLINGLEKNHVILPKVQKLLRKDVNFYEAIGEKDKIGQNIGMKELHSRNSMYNKLSSLNLSTALLARRRMSASWSQKVIGEGLPSSKGVFRAQSIIPKASYRNSLPIASQRYAFPSIKKGETLPVFDNFIEK